MHYRLWAMLNRISNTRAVVGTALNRPLQRRTVLRGLAILPLGVYGRRSSNRGPTHASVEALRDEISRLLRTRAAAYQVFARARTQYGAALDTLASLDSLHAEVVARVGPLHTAAPSRVRAALRRCVAADYRAGRTLQVDGWVISISELTMCGAAYAAHEEA